MKIFKKSASIFLIFVLMFLTSCSGKGGRIEAVSSSLTGAGEDMIVKFVIKNGESEQISDLKIKAAIYDEKQNKIDEAEMTYPIKIEPGEEVTLSARCDESSRSAEITEYSYKKGGKEVSGKFDSAVTAKYEEPTTADKSVNTREKLAEVLIDDIKSKFRADGYNAEGHYDKDKKQLIIAAYFNKSYKACAALYQIDPTQWQTLAESIASMSKTCLNEFESHNFSDVHVSVGMMSSDDEILISATDGEIVDMFN